MTELTIKLLGAPQIELNNELVATDRRKAIALLAYLVVTAVPHSRELLATLFWPESDQSRALAYLRRALWELNHILGEGWLAIDREQVTFLFSDSVWVDVVEFEKQLDTENIADALALYRGDFMAGFTLRDCPDFDEWQYQQAEAMQRTLRKALEGSVAQLVESGDLETAVSQTQQWLTLDPLDEKAHRALIHLYAQMGQRSAAMRQYERCVQLLETELGVSPEAETVALFQQVQSGQLTPKIKVPELSGMTISPPRAPSTKINNLPIPPTPFIGRQNTLAQLDNLFDNGDHNLITLVGPGGMGKTRLAIQLAQTKAADFADGACFVHLTPLESLLQLVPTIAKALQITFHEREDGSSIRTQLLEYLTGKEILFIFDNFEHLVAEMAHETPFPLVNEILATAPGSKIINTSRIRLNLQGETVFTVPGMDVPESVTAVSTTTLKQVQNYSSLMLFNASAQRVMPGFAITEANLPAVINICQFVEGMPLGIELAASWLDLLTLAEIQTELQKSLDILETELLDIPARQRSLRAVFDSTWALLTEDEQHAFQQLSLFTAGFTREAAVAVAGASLRMLMRLVNKSLLRREENGRFAIHELLRQFATEKLQATPQLQQAAHQAHSTFYLDYLLNWGAKMSSSEQGAAFTAVDNERANIHQAWRWAIDHNQFAELEKTLPILLIFYIARSITEQDIEILQKAINRSAETTAVSLIRFRAKCQLLFLWFVNQFEHGYDRHPISEEVYRNLKSHQLEAKLGLWTAMLGSLYGWQVDPQIGTQLLRQAYTESAQSNTWEHAYLAQLMGSRFLNNGKPDEARIYLAESLQINRETNNQLGLTMNLRTLAKLNAIDRDYEAALQNLQQVQKYMQAFGDRLGVASVMFQFGLTFMEAGDYNEAVKFMQEGKKLYEQAGHHFQMLSMDSWASIALTRAGDYETALRLREQSLQSIVESAGMVWHIWEMGELQRVMGNLAAAREWFDKAMAYFKGADTLGVAFYYRGLGDMAYANGRFTESYDHFEYSRQLTNGEITIHQTVQDYWPLCYAHSGLGRASVALGNYDEAHHHFASALKIAHSEAEIGINLIAIAGFAELFAVTNREEEAVELAAFIEAQPGTWQEFRKKATIVLENLAPIVEPEAFAHHQENGRSMNFDAVVEQLLS